MMFKKFTQTSIGQILKRRRTHFIFLSVFATLGLLGFTAVSKPDQLLAAFSLVGLVGVGWGIVFRKVSILPYAFVLGATATLAHFPNFSWFFKSLILMMFGSGFYVLTLAENIFRAAQERPIPLLRPAQTAAFLLTLLTVFLLFTSVYKLHLGWLGELGSLLAISFLLSLENLRTINLPKAFSRPIQYPSLLISLVVVEAGICISFLPIESFFRSLTISTAFYTSLGIAQQWFRHTLRARSLWGYLFIFGAVVLATFVFA